MSKPETLAFMAALSEWPNHKTGPDGDLITGHLFLLDSDDEDNDCCSSSGGHNAHGDREAFRRTSKTEACA